MPRQPPALAGGGALASAPFASRWSVSGSAPKQAALYPRALALGPSSGVCDATVYNARDPPRALPAWPFPRRGAPVNRSAIAKQSIAVRLRSNQRARLLALSEAEGSPPASPFPRRGARLAAPVLLPGCVRPKQQPTHNQPLQIARLVRISPRRHSEPLSGEESLFAFRPRMFEPGSWSVPLK
jgi:hypothetical protein